MVELIVLVLSAPVLAYSLYTALLLAGSLAYSAPPLSDPPRGLRVTALIATFNEKNVVERTLDSLARVEYPRELFQVIVADDSTDETAEIVRRKVDEMKRLGIDASVCSREGRDGYKAGALNGAVTRATGDYILLLDADSTVPPGVVRDGLSLLSAKPELSFVSYRVGHYNREFNLVTRTFALFQDATDTLQKMGSSRLGLPFSMQGGFAMVRADRLREVGFWTEWSLADDADLSCKLFEAGGRGYYMYYSVIESEDPWALQVWKRQFARVAEGWAQALRSRTGKIIRSGRLGPVSKAALLMTLLSPFASFSWIAVTFLSAFAIILGILQPQNSIFNSPVYVSLLAVPAVAFITAGVDALRMRGELDARNLALLTQVSYVISGMFVVSAIGFLRGLAGRRGEFIRTPKRGAGKDGYSVERRFDGTSAAELLLGSLGVLLSVYLLASAQFFLGLSMLGFGAFTLKSMELTKLIHRRRGKR